MALALVIALAGCSTTLTVNSGSSELSRSSATTGRGGLHVQGQVHSRSLAAVILAGLLIGAALEDGRDERPFPSLSTFFSDWMGPRPPLPLLPGRHISEQDCTQPVDPAKGNLRCR
jgi:hypothetical protein